MKHIEFTDKIGEAMVEASQKFCAASKTSCCSPVCYWTEQGPVARAEVCHRPAVDSFLREGLDIFGVIYRGGGYGEKAVPVSGSCTEQMTPEARDYLWCLVNEEGPFRELLPYMWHADADQIMEDKVIVFRNLADKELNAGLLWTFIQATRYMFEEPHHMPVFQHLRKQVPDNPTLALFATFCIQPYMSRKLDGAWVNSLPGHCAPLGRQPSTRAKGFLTGTLTKCGNHNTSGSADCFGCGRALNLIVDYRRPAPSKTLDEYLSLFMKEAELGLKAA